MAIAGAWKMNIFDVLEIDIDKFVLVANYLIKMGKEQRTTKTKPYAQKEQRIRVNDSTATGGWF